MNTRAGSVPGGSLGCLIGGLLMLAALYFIIVGLYKILYWAAPALIVLALIVNWRAVADTGKNFVESLKANPISAILSLAICVLIFPFFSLYLLLKALGYNKLEQLKQQYGTPINSDNVSEREDEFIDFEEIETIRKEEPKNGQAPKNIGE